MSTELDSDRYFIQKKPYNRSEPDDYPPHTKEYIENNLKINQTEMKKIYDTIIESEKDGSLYTKFAKYLHEIKTNPRLCEAINNLKYEEFMKKMKKEKQANATNNEDNN